MNLSKKFTSCKLKWNIWLLEGIIATTSYVFMSGIHICPSILLMDMQIWFVHAEILTADVHDRGIDLDPIDRYWPIYTGELMGNRTSREANDTDAV